MNFYKMICTFLELDFEIQGLTGYSLSFHVKLGLFGHSPSYNF